ncbi:MAG: NAD(P)-dependent oxidoreductase [Lachnospiraceae bacterium]|nr:NAD(P)-dependent oxidoreductase [Lachnospiraceae bacterium]
MKRAVITGPTGAVGTALAQCLIDREIEVLAVCRRGSKRIGNLPKSPYLRVVECSLDELNRLPSLAEGTYDAFYHFGWDGTFGNARNNMPGQLKNIQYTLDAVEAAAQLGCTVFVGAGSQAEYGRVEGDLREDTPAFPENGYGIAKLCAGQMSRILCEQKGIRHVWTRILSVYGPNDGEKTMIMATIQKLLAGEKPALTKGEQQWDYLYSKDAAAALYLLGKKGKNGRIYCLGSGKARPLLDYIEWMRDEIDTALPLGIGEIPYAPKQVMYLCADISALREDTGFEPQYTFQEGIRETIEWVREEP